MICSFPCWKQHPWYFQWCSHATFAPRGHPSNDPHWLLVGAVSVVELFQRKWIWVVPKIKGSKSGTESHSRVCYRFRSFALSLSDIALGHTHFLSHKGFCMNLFGRFSYNHWYHSWNPNSGALCVAKKQHLPKKIGQRTPAKHWHRPRVCHQLLGDQQSPNRIMKKDYKIYSPALPVFFLRKLWLLVFVSGSASTARETQEIFAPGHPPSAFASGPNPWETSPWKPDCLEVRSATANSTAVDVSMY